MRVSSAWAAMVVSNAARFQNAIALAVIMGIKILRTGFSHGVACKLGLVTLGDSE